MTLQVLMPKVGLTMTEGRIVEWKKREGEPVEKGEILFVFETEKVAFEVEAAHSGFLARILKQVDETVQVGEVVGLLTESEEGRAELNREKPPDPKERPELPGPETPGPDVRADRGEKVRATPMARRIARERGIDLENVSATGAGGRIRMEDVESAAGSAPSPQGAPEEAEGRLVKLSGMRKIIAERMMAGKRETAQIYMTVSIDATNLLETRERLPLLGKSEGVRPTITDLLMKICASAVSSHPILNTRWTSEGILWLDAIHMGMAMALEEGLIVPVIRDIGKKTLSEIAKERTAIVEKGKSGKLTPDEMKGSTFTISSLGMFGIEEFAAIINPPESAILAVGAILDKPVAIDKQIVVRPVMKMTLSYDHRVIDGAKAAGFMMTLKELIETRLP
jgi:pyruvate dehydrogenase E2 component (dihydrolipoamide acetyltransferase)